MKKQKSKSIFVCQECGAQRPRWEGRCPECGAWNTLIEEKQVPETAAAEKGRGWTIAAPSQGVGTAKTHTLSQKISTQNFRIPTGIGELDRVLGGGLVQGGFTLLGGDPGIGKSTLLLQMAAKLGDKGTKVLYVSAEESVEQTLNRAHRLGLNNDNVHVAAENNLLEIFGLIESVKPNVTIVDSIQTIYHPEITSAPGSVSQVRDCAGHLMALAKSHKISIFLIGHITKDGNLAGPKVLEHMVDCVLSFEGDTNYQFRLLRSIKNRFGAANELGVFTMNSEGLEEVSNPSELFLEERSANVIGSTIFPSIEGSRPLLCEIQALCSPTPMAMPRRNSIGVDVNRVHMLLAVLIKHLNLQLFKNDVYINVVGGLKLTEPAVDLAVAASLVSSENEKPVDSKTCYFGEIGLTGEIRAVSFPELRIKEALKLGFNRFYVPKSNQKHLKSLMQNSEVKIIWVERIKDIYK